jgi:DNA-directed RNA polymerase subunit RPC12/RpoP
MIRFTCPTCRAILGCPDHKAGRKMPCPKCGQRLLVPNPIKPAANNKTVLGEPLPAPDRLDDVRAANASTARIPPPPLQSSAPRLINCPGCHSQLEVQNDGLEQQVDCPSCGTRFTALPDEPETISPDPVASTFAGDDIQCDGCDRLIMVPRKTHNRRGKTRNQLATDFLLLAVFFLCGLMCSCLGGGLVLVGLSSPNATLGGFIVAVGLALFGVLVMFISMALGFFRVNR